MKITPLQRQAVAERIIGCYEKAENEFGVTLKRPEIIYKLKGTTAGRAFPYSHRIDLNEGLLARNFDKFFQTTIPHEAAHLIAPQVYNERRLGHGDKWVTVMRALGVKEITRCHQYDVTETKIQKTYHRYTCPHGCDMKVYGKIHNKISIGHQRICKRHKAAITYKETIVPESRAASPTLWTPRGTGSKMDLCLELFNIYGSSRTRKEMIQKFIIQVGCTPAGASTYYYNCQKLTRK